MSEQEHEAEAQASLVKRLEDLANLLQKSSVGEIELAEGGTEVTIKRQQEEAASPSPQTQGFQKQEQKQEQSPQESRAKQDLSVAVTAPLSGIFYASPSPGAAPFVKVGDSIQPEQVIALIETMKVFNEIRPDVAGRLIQISVESGSLIKKGDTLFRVEPV
jgi:acetyl-CoA carboxylase biotin carboxyl carrier protein